MKATEYNSPFCEVKSDSPRLFSRWYKMLLRTYTVARAVYPKPSLKAVAERLLFILRSIRCYPQANHWYEWLNKGSLAPVSQTNPILYKKIVRPYINPSWTVAQKLLVLKTHYTFLADHLSASAFLQSCTPTGHALLNLVHEDEQLQVRWVSDPRYSKEGELSLVLTSAKYRCYVSSLTFVILKRSTGPGYLMLIGATQGLPPDAHKDIIKEISKQLHGLRPKALLLFIAQEVANIWQLKELKATSNKLHISRHRDYALNSTRRPNLSYDSFWEESGGKIDPVGYYDLPLQLVRRSDAEIKSNKRSLYHRRYQLLARLTADLQACLAGFSKSPSLAIQPYPHRAPAEHSHSQSNLALESMHTGS